MKEHELKTVEPYFGEVWHGHKTFEYRFNDRDFRPGDEVKLRRYFPESNEYGDRFIMATIGFVLTDDYPTVNKGYCVFSLINTRNFRPI